MLWPLSHVSNSVVVYFNSQLAFLQVVLQDHGSNEYRFRIRNNINMSLVSNRSSAHAKYKDFWDGSAKMGHRENGKESSIRFLLDRRGTKIKSNPLHARS